MRVARGFALDNDAALALIHARGRRHSPPMSPPLVLVLEIELAIEMSPTGIDARATPIKPHRKLEMETKSEVPGRTRNSRPGPQAVNGERALRRTNGSGPCEWTAV